MSFPSGSWQTHTKSDQKFQIWSYLNLMTITYQSSLQTHTILRLKICPQVLSSNGVNESYDERESGEGGDEFTKTKANEKKDKKVKRAEEKRRQKEAKRAAAAAEAAEAEYIPGAARPEKAVQQVLKNPASVWNLTITVQF